MESIDLFADSFGDQRIFTWDAGVINEYTGKSARYHKTWVDLLNYHYNVKNFSVSGTGAHYQLQKLMDLTSADRLLPHQQCSDFLLFMMPDINRLNLDYVEENRQASTMTIFKQKETGTFDPNFWEFNENLVQLSDKIFSDYVGFYSAQLHKILEPLIVQYVFSKSNVYKKILVWCSSGSGYPFKHNNDITIPSNCHIVEGSLHLISSNELKDDNDEPDTRTNHLCEDNHKFLARSVYHYFKHGTLPDVSKLIEDPSYKTDPPQDFIYD